MRDKLPSNEETEGIRKRYCRQVLVNITLFMIVAPLKGRSEDGMHVDLETFIKWLKACVGSKLRVL